MAGCESVFKILVVVQFGHKCDAQRLIVAAHDGEPALVRMEINAINRLRSENLFLNELGSPSDANVLAIFLFDSLVGIFILPNVHLNRHVKFMGDLSNRSVSTSSCENVTILRKMTS